MAEGQVSFLVSELFFHVGPGNPLSIVVEGPIPDIIFHFTPLGSSNCIGSRSARCGHSIRRALTEEMVSATDKRVKFIGGLATYEAAGGPVKRDLFDKHNDGYATDAALLEKLVAEKLETTAADVRAEGWNGSSAALPCRKGFTE